MADDPKPTEETHDLFVPDVPIVMPKGELPVVRDGTVGGLPAYEADPLKKSCGCPSDGNVCLHTPIEGVDYSGFEWLGISRDNPIVLPVSRRDGIVELYNDLVGDDKRYRTERK